MPQDTQLGHRGGGCLKPGEQSPGPSEKVKNSDLDCPAHTPFTLLCNCGFSVNQGSQQAETLFCSLPGLCLALRRPSAALDGQLGLNVGKCMGQKCHLASVCCEAVTCLPEGELMSESGKVPFLSLPLHSTRTERRDMTSL